MPPYRVQVLDRVFRILDLLERGEAALPQIAPALALHKSTAHRLLTILETRGFVERNGAGKYRIGPRVIELGLAALAKLDLYEVAGPHLRALADATGETAHLAILRNGEIVSLMTADGRQTLRAPGAIGDRKPAYCTAIGKAMLAHAEPGPLSELLKTRSLPAFTPRTITSPKRLQSDLKTTLERGYAVDNEEWELGLRCIGAPVRDSSGVVMAAVSISGPVFRIKPARVAALGAVVVDHAAGLSRALGFLTPPKKSYKRS
jgi:DNA-binding IclR family transcriptional regulator